jgi:DNA-binding response OmpR family regulator
VNLRVLLIEDDLRLAGMLAEYLGEHGVGLTHASDAASGIDRALGESFDAVLLDVMLPDGDGFDVCRSLRKRSDVPILMLTARGEELDRVLGLELGADDYLPKPFSARELLARLRAVLRRSATRTPAQLDVLRFGSLEIDRSSRVARRDGQVCELTSHQFELLRVLAESAGRPLSRDQIMQALRGESLAAFDRSIDVHISRIRAAIETDPRRPQRIRTVRGVGYVFTRDPGDA